MSEETKAIIERFREIVKGGERLMTDKELNEMIDWCNGVNYYGYCNCRDVMCKNAMYVQNKDGSRIQIEH